MKRSFLFIFVFICISLCVSRAFAWTDDVEGMLMPAAAGTGGETDPEAILENIEGPEEGPSGADAPEIRWE